MDISIKDWYECPCRQAVDSEKKFIKSHRYFHEKHFMEYANGICAILSSEENNIPCPKTSSTHQAGTLVGDAPQQCPLRKESITLRTGHRFGEITFHD